jgi:DNA-binding CsgD family transcriptional regulator
MGTQMHMVTFVITVFEILMVSFQVIYLLERPNDRKRFLYLVLLVLLILYNITSGLFPDVNIPISIKVQTVIAYFVAFTMSMYCVYYFHKAFDLKLLKFFATFGSIIFLLVPFLFLFILPYYLTGNLEFSRKLTVVIPFFYGIAFIVVTTRAFIFKFQEKEYSDTAKVELVIAAYVALLCWVALPVIVFFGDFQVLEHSVTNAGFLIMTIVYVRSTIHQSRREYNLLLTTGQNREKVIALNCEKYSLTTRETEIVNLIVKGQSYKIIGSALNISEKTVAKHVSNIFSKATVTNKIELIYKLEAKE